MLTQRVCNVLVRVRVRVRAVGQDDPGYFDYLWDQADFPKLLAVFEAEGLRETIRVKDPTAKTANELLNQTLTASRAQGLLGRGYSVVLPLEGLSEVPKDTKIAHFAQGSVDAQPPHVLYFVCVVPCSLVAFLAVLAAEGARHARHAVPCLCEPGSAARTACSTIAQGSVAAHQP